ncbi:Dna-directed rna polymerase [Thalictrum thalictroides]|uniref:DNA-directed RNA polymerase subunit n=1 Tax=Thalictrum thalictroides TaxID=46969 RepID=A0A7J6V7A9_THATH|nr:Dna-directed rna polymerase [Thalictrum thalictroides]
MEVFKLSKANLVVYLHPSKGNDVPQAIRYELSKLLFKFHEVFDGVVLAYNGDVVGTNAKILPRIHPNEITEKQTTNAKIRPSIHPYFGVRLKATLLLFSPKPDMLLEGKVMKLGQESIHVVVLGFCSAVITEEDIRQDFRYKIKHGEEVYATRSDKRHVIKVGSMIRFLVKSMDEEILHISGSLVPPNTGSIKWLDHRKEDDVESERKVKKRKGENSKETRMQANGQLDEQLLQQARARSFKKSKKQQSGEER